MTSPKTTVPKAPLLGPERASARVRGEPPSHGPLPDPVTQKNDDTPSDSPSPSSSTEPSSATPAPPPEPIDVSQPKKKYPYSHHDLDPLPASASDAQKKAHDVKLTNMGIKTLEVYKEIELTGEDLWIEFISTFRPHSIKAWDHGLVTKWTYFLRRGGVYVENGRVGDKTQKLIDLL